MAVEYIEYPRHDIRMIEPYIFGITNEKQNYFLHCFDKNKGVYQYLGLRKTDDTFIVDLDIDVKTDVLTKNYKELDINSLPTIIKCPNGKTPGSELIDFIVINYYNDKTNNKLYIPGNGYAIAKENEVEIEGQPRNIEGKDYYSITKEQFDILQEKTTHTCTWNEKYIILEKPKTLQESSCSFGNKTYIPEYIFTQYKPIDGRSRIKVDGKLYIEVSDIDLRDLEMFYMLKNIELKLSPVDIEPVEKNTPIQR